MGLEVGREQFEPHEFVRFEERLARSLEALRALLARPGFGRGPMTLGAELELFLIDAEGLPLPLNREVLAGTLDPRLTVELDRFNLECNLRPTELAGRPFAALAGEMRGALAEAERAAAVHGGRVAMIGILPTLRESDLQRGAMTDAARYRALSAALRQLRRGPFRLRIDGAEPLAVTCEDLTFEGANTSLQLHLRVAPERFASVFNAVQLATGPALAIAANSPTFLGRRLWEETRIAVFKQSVDDRGDGRLGESRVAFGSGWVTDGPAVLFERAVLRHAPLLPLLSEEDPAACVAAGGVPRLEELRLHYGTVWHWNRAVYDPVDGGHVRIEMRALPAGPTVADMLANAAFLIGLSLSIAEEGEAWIRDLPFVVPEHNFYRAAQDGLAAELLFPAGPGRPAEPIAAASLVERLLPLAQAGLVAAGVAEDEGRRTLAPIAERLTQRRTGASWQSVSLASLEPVLGRPRGLAAMFESYLGHAAAEQPLHAWPRPEPAWPLHARAVPAPADVPPRVEDFLRMLGGPTLLRLPGRDRSRTRAVVTLLHGNEPSGVRAVHALLREGFEPAVDALFFIGSVEAALAEPGFAQRQLEGARDLNRCFRDRAGREGRVAGGLLELLEAAAPEALVDLHNNTGRSVPYGVGPRAGASELELVALFADRYVHSDLKLGALVELVAEQMPSVVVECGRAGAPAADAVARAGLERYLGQSRLAGRAARSRVNVMIDPVRVEVLPGTRLALGNEAHPDADLTVAAELDQHNFGRLEPGHTLGWLRQGAPWPLRALGGDGRDVSAQFFTVDGCVLRAREALLPIMITNDPGIALGDCLFYVVRRREGTSAPRSS